MPKLVILKFDSGNFQNGFKVTLRIGNEGESLTTERPYTFPPNLLLPDHYQRWQSNFLELDKCLRGRQVGTRIIDSTKILNQCQLSAQHLIDSFKNWLQDSVLQGLRETLCQQLGSPTEAIRVIIQTDDSLLKKLPWHHWDLWADTYTQAEVAISPTEYEKPGVVLTTNKTVVRILAILGNSEGIDIDKDKQSLTDLQSQGADIQFLPEPERTKISDHLWEQNWDILFFAGHSSSQGDKGQIFINRTESLTVDELRFGLKKAIEHGLQLAILNSCDGLKLAEDLADLNIPQVVVMREPVPDQVAQTFLQFFLKAFAAGESLYVAVRQARERLQENRVDDKFPGASGLPIICQNPTVIPPTWEALKMPMGSQFRGGLKPSTPKPWEEVDGGGIMSNFGNVQFLLSHFLPGLIAGVAGLSLAVLLFVYRDIIAKDIFPQLTQVQATVVIFSVIGLTFFIAVIGIYAWLATRQGLQFKYVVVFMVLIFAILAVMLVAGISIYAWLATKEGISFQYLSIFMILILTILSFIFVAIYMVAKNEKGSKIDDNAKPEPPSHWYLKAIKAMERGNKSIALEYVNRGLKEVSQNTPKHVAGLLALKIKVLLLIGGNDNRTEARNVADQNYGHCLATLDRWIDCLRQQNFFSSIITTETELETQCPSPNYSNKQ